MLTYFPASARRPVLPTANLGHGYSRAFTLIELLVAMTVSLILIAALLQVFSATTATWQRGEAQMDAFREARGALQLMARDLSTTAQPYLVQADGTPNAASPLLPTLALARYKDPAPPLEDSAAVAMNEEIYALTNTVDQPAIPSTFPNAPPPSPPSILVSQRAPDLCAVGYFCQWMPDIASPAAKIRAPKAFALMRQYLNGDDTSARIQFAVKARTTGTTTAQTPLNFLELFERASLVLGVAAKTTPPVGRATQLAAYVWDLKFRIDTNTFLVGDSQTSTTARDHSRPARVYDGNTPPYPAVLPAYVEIRFKAMSTTSIRRINGQVNAKPSDWLTPVDVNQASSFYKSYVLPGAEQFVLRVPLLNSNPSPAASPTP